MKRIYLLLIIIFILTLNLKSYSKPYDLNYGLLGGYNKLYFSLPKKDQSFSYNISGIGHFQLTDLFGAGGLLSFERQLFKAMTIDDIRKASIDNMMTSLTFYGSVGYKIWDIFPSFILGPKISYINRSTVKVELDSVEKREFLSQQNRFIFGTTFGLGVDYDVYPNFLVSIRGLYNYSFNKQITSYAFVSPTKMESLQVMTGVSYITSFKKKNLNLPAEIKFISDPILTPDGDEKNDYVKIRISNLKDDINKNYYLHIVDKENGNIIQKLPLDKDNEVELKWDGSGITGSPLIINYRYNLELFLDDTKVPLPNKPEIYIYIYLPKTLPQKLCIYGIDYKLDDFSISEASALILNGLMELVNGRNDVKQLKIVLYYSENGIESLNKIIQEKFAEKIKLYLNGLNPKKIPVWTLVIKANDPIMDKRKHYMELWFE